MANVVLFVDDDIAILNSLKEQFKEEFNNEFICEIAQSAQEGLEILKEFLQDPLDILLVVSDWLMPGMKGDEFLIEVNKLFPMVKKVMLSGQADEGAIQNAQKNANLDKFISKPWNPEELFQIIRSYKKEY